MSRVGFYSPVKLGILIILDLSNPDCCVINCFLFKTGKQYLLLINFYFLLILFRITNFTVTLTVNELVIVEEKKF